MDSKPPVIIILFTLISLFCRYDQYRFHTVILRLTYFTLDRTPHSLEMEMSVFSINCLKEKGFWIVLYGA